MVEILECLKKYGQRLDLEIAQEMRMPLATVRKRLAGLAASGAVITCSLTRFEGGKRIDAWQCRVSGYVPPLAPGRKAKSTAPSAVAPARAAVAAPARAAVAAPARATVAAPARTAVVAPARTAAVARKAARPRASRA